jgi:hypothetical protein
MQKAFIWSSYDSNKLHVYEEGGSQVYQNQQLQDLGSGKARDFEDKSVCAEADLVLLEDGKCVHFML